LICPFCDYIHDNEDDRYGCPNCLGEGSELLTGKITQIEVLKALVTLHKLERHLNLGMYERQIWPDVEQALEKIINNMD
tara:strand:- start:341 stop:577 length:237 start_codon:yes stop_codon:yes gene_type:complete